MIALVFLSWIAAVVTPSAEAQLTCSPAPCVTPNVPVGASDPSTTVAGLALAASPLASSEDLGITANYLVNMSPCYDSGSDSSLSSAFTSLDQGSTWSGGCQPTSGSDVIAEYDPIAAYDSSGNLFSGQLGATSTTGGVFLQELPAGSAIWGNLFPTLAYTDAKTVDFYVYDFPGLAIDNNSSPSCLYVTAWEFGVKQSNNELLSAVAVGHSCDGGTTWTTKRVSSLVASPNVASYSRVAVAEDGSVLATWIQNSGGKAPRVFASSSPDGGNTWSTPANVFNIAQPAEAACNNNPHVDRALPHTCVRMFYFPQLGSTYSTSTGETFHAVYPNYNGSHVAINYRSSSNGSNWSSPLVLSSVSADQFEPCISSPSQTSSTLGVAWLDTRNSPASKPNTLYDAYGIVSTDGGLTWSSVYRLSTESGSPTLETEPHSQYLGDWTGCAWENGVFYYAFPSTANGSHQVAMIAGLNP